MKRVGASRAIVVPAALRPGARIAVVAPGSRARPRPTREGLRILRRWGYEPVPAPHLFARDGDLAGDDASRAEDLVWALTTDDVDAVWAARGGWGAARLLDRLPAARVRRRAPLVVGFSDVTALQMWLLGQGLASLYAPLVGELAEKTRYLGADLRAALSDPAGAKTIRVRREQVLKRGRAKGRLVPACLSVLVSLAGTRWQPDLRGAILVLEDVGEAPYRIDRMLWQLSAAGVTRGLAGLAFGQFTGCRPAAGRPSRRLSQILRAHAAILDVPAVSGVPVGHGPRTRVLPVGVHASLDASAGLLRVGGPAAGR